MDLRLIVGGVRPLRGPVGEWFPRDQPLVTMVVSLYQQGRDQTIKMVLKRIGNEWKLDGPPRSSSNR